MLINSKNNKHYKKWYEWRTERWPQGRYKEILGKIKEEIEQDEDVICTISKDSNHIGNQDLITQKERRKVCFS